MSIKLYRVSTNYFLLESSEKLIYLIVKLYREERKRVKSNEKRLKKRRL